MSQLVR